MDAGSVRLHAIFKRPETNSGFLKSLLSLFSLAALTAGVLPPTANRAFDTSLGSGSNSSMIIKPPTYFLPSMVSPENGIEPISAL